MRTVVTDSNAGGWGKGGKGGQERGWVGVIKPYSVNKLRVRGCIIILIITSTTATNQFCLGCPPPLQWHQMKICIHYRNKYCKQLSSYLIDQQILCHTILGPSCNIMQLQKYFQSIFNDFSFLRVLGLSCCTRGLQMNWPSKVLSVKHPLHESIGEQSQAPMRAVTTTLHPFLTWVFDSHNSDNR